MDMDKLDRVSELSDEAKEVVRWAIVLEGALHSIASHMDGVPEHVRDFARSKIHSDE
jgi:hypothetical protein